LISKKETPELVEYSLISSVTENSALLTIDVNTFFNFSVH